ncbi:hypothetical protein RUM44_005244 [Polyplax serrata]|uniref:Uncharacterized protein n=1 Tax=Polyplax serrata TaxID=468196 RepID=A0ABR1AEG4_POLSC
MFPVGAWATGRRRKNQKGHRRALGGELEKGSIRREEDTSSLSATHGHGADGKMEKCPTEVLMINHKASIFDLWSCDVDVTSFYSNELQLARNLTGYSQNEVPRIE